MTPQRLRSPLGILLIAYILLASIYSIITPLFEASDELWHYPTVKYIADHGLQLPVQDPNVQTAWRQEGSQPPLYYMMSAVLTFWIDTSDFEKVRRLNPHSDIGIIVPDGNANIAIHDPAVESFPWRGTVLAVHIVRFFSMLLGAVTVAMTYWLTLELFPEQRWLAVAAAAFTAFNPMFLFISGSVNNDNLSNAVAATLLVLIVRLMKRTSAPSNRELIVIGVAMGAGLLAKLNVAILIPFIALSLALIAYRLRSWNPFVVGGLITGGLTLLVAGWWYVRNWQLYGDPTGLNMFLQIVGRRPVPPNWAQLWSERDTFLMSYWGFFGGVNVPMPDWTYVVFNAIAAISVVGLITALIMWMRRIKVGNWILLLGRAFTVIWIVALFIGLIRWTSETWASQGRLMFAAIAPLSMWMAIGLASWKWFRGILSSVSIVWFVGIGCIVSPLTIFGTYSTSVQNSIRTAQSLIHFAPDHSGPPFEIKQPTVVMFKEDSNSQPVLEMDYTFSKVPDRVYVGSYKDTTPNNILFRVNGKISQDWSVFIHLENEAGLIVAQRDVYPKQGLAATSLLKENDKWTNYFAIRIPDQAYAPQLLNMYLGFYNPQTNKRLIAKEDTGANNIYGTEPQITDDNRVLLGQVQLLPRPSAVDVPNPIFINFGNEAELVGYDVSDLVMYPGKKVTITLYWRALKPLTTSYRIFAQVLEPGTTHVFGSSDGEPVNWTYPTTLWKVGEIIKDEHTLTIHNDAPPGIWQIQAGIYNEETGTRLPMMTREGGEADNVVLLTRIKITLAPESF